MNASDLRPEDLRQDWARTLAKVISIEDGIIERTEALAARIEAAQEQIRVLQLHQAKIHLLTKSVVDSQADVVNLGKALLDTVPGSVQKVNAELDALAEQVLTRAAAAVDTHLKQITEESIRRERAAEAHIKETITSALTSELAQVAEQRKGLFELQREILQSIALAQEKDRPGFVSRLFGAKS